MMLDWNAYPEQVHARIKEMSRFAPNAVAGFFALANGASKTTYLDAKTRELIAIAIAVTTRCDGCIGVHTDRHQGGGDPRRSSRGSWHRHRAQCRCGLDLFGSRVGCLCRNRRCG